ncbi:MAG: glucose-1-phosphate adenylyltransferase subunit GlgD, partial [Epulopiscium sp. Nuni2H_MBin001]
MRAVGIILAGAKRSSMGVLTEHRNNSAMPVGGAYRTIDFALTNFSQSGVKKVAVISQHSTRSLADHISSSKWWNFGRKNSGIFLFTPDMVNADSFSFKGTADAIYQNIQFLKRSQEPYVIICPGEQVIRIDYNKVIKYHEEQGADITLVCKDMGNESVLDYGVAELDEENRLVGFEEKPLDPQSSTISLGIYVIERQLLIQLLEQLNKEGRHSIVTDIIMRYRKKLKIVGYMFDGYWQTLKNIETLFATNMDFLDPEKRSEIFSNGYVYTKAKDDPPV